METIPGSLRDDWRALDPDHLLTSPEEPRRPLLPPWATPPRIERFIEVSVLVVVIGFTFLQLGPSNLLENTTPAGGDMGAHVWGPAYLRDHLLPDLRLSGWAPDWYDGFPAYQFYMVLPALLIVVVNAGLHGWAALPAVAGAAGLGWAAWRSTPHSARRRALVAGAIVVLVAGVGLPYGVAFKVVSVVGLLTLPLAVYAMARLAELPFPAPPLLVLASMLFLFNREPILNGTGNIVGGNVTSTLAGEFSFSLSLTLAILFMGVMITGFRTGRYRWLGALLFGLTALCHIIPAIYAGMAAAAALVVWPGRRGVVWLATVLPVGGLVSAFWALPFLGRSEYLNDMGWEKVPAGAGAHGWWTILTDGDLAEMRETIIDAYLVPSTFRWIVLGAIIGLVVSLLTRNRFGVWLGLLATATALLFVVMPEARLWNARVLPLYYLCAALLAAVGVSELCRAVAVLVARDADRPPAGLAYGVAGVLLVAVVIRIGLPLGSVGSLQSDGSYSFGPFNLTEAGHPARGWAEWNYTGFEGKPAYPEYHALVTTMARVGADHGCGRAMWEYDDARLGSYGTPMAPMLLPYWTDGCIGSMEGLYFEASATTPFHFMNQAELSARCSCAQRNLPYGTPTVGLNLDLGIRHLQLLGVRYYLAVTPEAVDLAAVHPDLTEVAESGPWHVYLVAGSEVVEPLANEPAVVTDDASGIAWVYGQGDPHTSPIKANGPAMSWYLDPTRWDVFVAADGPSGWQRVDRDDVPERRAAAEVKVSGIEVGRDSIAFDVDEPGTPVLVKVSYFPNWEVSGGDGPWRVAPNLMVVVPTERHVELTYGQTLLDRSSQLLSVGGIALVVLLARRDRPRSRAS